LSVEHNAPDRGLRRRRFVAPHRRRSTASLLIRSLLGAAALVAVPAALAWWILTSPRFLLAEVQVRGVEEVSPEWVFERLETLEGRHLLGLPLRAVEKRLIEHPWIEGVDVGRHLPNRLLIDVRERVPVILLRRPEGLFYVDRQGVLISEYDPEGLVDLILVSIVDETRLDVEEVLQVAADLTRASGSWGAGVSEFESLGAGDYRVHLTSVPCPVLVSAGSVERQVRSFRRVLPQIVHRFDSLEAVDLRFSNQIVIQPPGAMRIQEG